MHLAATLGTASVLMDWHHERTELSDEIKVIAAYAKLFSSLVHTLTGSIFPKDDLLLKFTPRAPPS